MKRLNTIHLAAALVALLVASLACDLPVEFARQGDTVGATETMQALATSVAGTLAPDPGDQAASDPGASGEGSAAPSPTPTLTSSVTPSPTSSVPMVSVSVDTNCRFGPGDVYEYQGALMVGEEAEVTGKLADESFWYIENPDAPPPYCWVWGAYAQVVGDTSGLPILTPPPTPTPTLIPLNFSVSLDTAGSCMTWGLFLWVENTGSGTFESIKVIVEDPDLGETKTSVGDYFPDSKACILSSVPEKLPPGAGAYAAAFGFSANLTGHDVHVTVKLCTEDGLGGDCVQKTVDGVVPSP